MAGKASMHGLHFRPHFKTHQSIEIGRWFQQVGVKAVTVSSVTMAEYFANNGWTDITIAFPVYSNDIGRISSLSRRIRLNIIASSAANLAGVVEHLNHEVGVFIELDTGHGRSGVGPDNTREIAIMAMMLQQNGSISFKGFITHSGHTYAAKSSQEVAFIHKKTLSTLIQLKSFWRETYPGIIASIGDTPSCSIIDDFWGVDEIRPGNFVFYDMQQAVIGSCTPDDIALALICPVVDVNFSRGEVLIHGGAVHLSKDSFKLIDGTTAYGLVCPFDGTKWGTPLEGLYLRSVSQEHGVIASTNPDAIAKLAVGERVAILPAHSCLAVDTMGMMFLPDGTEISTMRQRVNIT